MPRVSDWYRKCYSVYVYKLHVLLRALEVSPLIIIIRTPSHSSLSLLQRRRQSSRKSSSRRRRCSRCSMSISRIPRRWWYRCRLLRDRSFRRRRWWLRLRSCRMAVRVSAIRNRWCGWWCSSGMLNWWWRRWCRTTVCFEVCRWSPALLRALLALGEPPACVRC